jgi:hypothetical protein
MTQKEKMIIYLLRIVGFGSLTAIIFVFCPLNWMDSIHQMLGFGPFPAAAMIEYLARTESALYAFLGMIFCFISFDLPRYQSLIRFMAWIIIPLSIAVTVLDIKLSFPLLWIIAEGPFTLLLGIILLILTQTRQK